MQGFQQKMSKFFKKDNIGKTNDMIKAHTSLKVQ